MKFTARGFMRVGKNNKCLKLLVGKCFTEGEVENGMICQSCPGHRVLRRQPGAPNSNLLRHVKSHHANILKRVILEHTAPEAEVSLILVSNQNLSRGWTFRANATRKWIFQKNLQREPILVLINTKNLFSTFWVIFPQNLKSILGFKPVTWIYYKSTIKLIFCQVFTKNSLFSGHH